ncbi:MAG: pirin family protein [Chloroflexota bacterium]
MIYKQSTNAQNSERAPFTIRRFFPGHNLPAHTDHGYGPLAVVDDATLTSGVVVPMHQHRNDEIVSYVHQGAMHHSDSSGANLVINAQNLMVMNAGHSFWHEERIHADKETTRTLQIFIRPHAVNLEPQLQHLPLDADQGITTEGSGWRYLVGPEGSDAPATVRNDVRIFDGRLAAGTLVSLPTYEAWDTYFMVLRGEVMVNQEVFPAVEAGCW